MHRYGNAISYLSIHGRSRIARYTNFADWDFIHQCSGRSIAAEHLFRSKRDASAVTPLTPVPVFGNGDVFNYSDWATHMDRVDTWKERIEEILSECEEAGSRLTKTLTEEPERIAAGALRDEDKEGLSLAQDLEALSARLETCMIGRGALIKPWLPTEIKEKRDWDISGSERWEILRSFVNYGLEHWGSDFLGVEKTRRFMLEWMSFTCRYVPLGVLDPLYVPRTINDRPPIYRGRDDRETLLSSANVSDWIKISEMFLGPVREGFNFEPKHKSNSYTPLAEDIIAGLV